VVVRKYVVARKGVVTGKLSGGVFAIGGRD
jgi:hypothetical protein